MKKTLPSLLFFLWTGILIITYYVVQKPKLFFLAGLADTLWTLLVAALMLFNAYGIGGRILKLIKFNSSESIDHLIFSLGIGLGGLGLLGLGVSATQIVNAPVLGSVQVALAAVFIICKDADKLSDGLKSLKAELNISFSQYNTATKLAVLLPLTFSFLLTLVPPFESFDALLYHLAQPAAILRDGGLRALDNVPFWFPNITENVYLWALALGSERAAQMMHFAWGILTALLLWHWSTKTWSIETGRKTLLLLAAIPSLPMLASWAYADMALTYYAVAAIYALTSHREKQTTPLLLMTAILSGMAMGVKYTSFVVPLTCGLIVLFQRPFTRSFRDAFLFSVVTLLTALPWYLRNAILMGNPFYPFVFGGRYWDDFLAAQYANAGSGIGWNAFEIFMLPLNLILGHRDATFFDGRLGPLFIILLPLTIWILLPRTPQNPSRRLSLVSIGLFSALSFAAWTFGVINSSALWQARLLFPAMMAFTIPTALGWDALAKLDTPKFRISFLVNALIAIVITLTLAENIMFVLQRNPLAVAVGAQSREAYIQRIAPSYYELMQSMDDLPADAHIYYLFEPRSYDMPRRVQPDALVTNFVHDQFLFKSPDAIIGNWKAQGYTHILVYETGMQFILDQNPGYQSSSVRDAITEILGSLPLVSQTQDKVYSIHRIP